MKGIHFLFIFVLLVGFSSCKKQEPDFKPHSEKVSDNIVGGLFETINLQPVKAQMVLIKREKVIYFENVTETIIDTTYSDNFGYFYYNYKYDRHFGSQNYPDYYYRYSFYFPEDSTMNYTEPVSSSRNMMLVKNEETKVDVFFQHGNIYGTQDTLFYQFLTDSTVSYKLIANTPMSGLLFSHKLVKNTWYQNPYKGLYFVRYDVIKYGWGSREFKFQPRYGHVVHQLGTSRDSTTMALP